MIRMTTKGLTPDAPCWWQPLMVETFGLSLKHATLLWRACCASQHPQVRGLLLRCSQLSDHLEHHNPSRDAYVLLTWITNLWSPRSLVQTVDYLRGEKLLPGALCSKMQETWLRNVDRDGNWLPKLLPKTK